MPQALLPRALSYHKSRKCAWCGSLEFLEKTPNSLSRFKGGILTNRMQTAHSLVKTMRGKELLDLRRKRPTLAFVTKLWQVAEGLLEFERMRTENPHRTEVASIQKGADKELLLINTDVRVFTVKNAEHHRNNDVGIITIDYLLPFFEVAIIDRYSKSVSKGLDLPSPRQSCSHHWGLDHAVSD